MSAFLDALAATLTTAGAVGGATGWTAVTVAGIDLPHQTVALYETGGLAPDQATDRSWGNPSFQAVTRATTAKAARDKAEAVRIALDRASVTGLAFLVAAQSTPVAIGPDASGRHLYAVNFRGGAT